MIDSEDQRVQKILQIVHRTTQKDYLTKTSGLRNGWDSLQHVQILLEVENCFHLQIPHEKFGELLTVNDIVSWVCSKNEKL